MRPQSFCCNCQKVSDIRDELEEMFFGPDGPPASIDDWRSTHKPTTITMALTAILGKDGNEFDEDEKILVKAVIEMLEGGTKDYNPEIFYADDLPE